MTPKRATLLLLFIVCCAGAPWGAHAGTKVNLPAVVVLNNGIKKQVTLIEEDSEEVKVLLPNGKVQVYKREDIKSIDWKLPPAFKAAEESLVAGEYGKAREQYQQTIAKESNAWCVAQARMRKLQCCLILDKYEEAAQEYVRIVKADPKSVNYSRIPLPLSQSPDNAKAAKYLRAIADLAKNDLVKGAATGLAASALAADKKTKEAEALAKSMLPISDPRVQGLAKILYGQIAVEKEDYDGAVKLLQKNMASIPDELLPAAYFWLGRAYLGKDEYERAVIAFMRCPTYMSHNQEIAGDSLFYGAKAFEKADRWREAARLYEYLVEDYPAARQIKQAKETLEKLRKLGGGG